jgi:hypothetical protein
MAVVAVKAATAVAVVAAVAVAKAATAAGAADVVTTAVAAKTASKLKLYFETKGAGLKPAPFRVFRSLSGDSLPEELRPSHRLCLFPHRNCGRVSAA